MSQRAFSPDFTPKSSVVPLLRTATVNGTGIDLANTNGNQVIFYAGAITDGTFTPKLQESSDNSTYTDVAAADQIGALSAMTANTLQDISYIGKLRYIRMVYTVTGSPATGGNVGGIVNLRYRKQ